MEGIGGLDAFGIGDDDGMSGVVPACTACTDVGLSSEDVDELAFALVAPLRSEHDGHYWAIRSGVGLSSERETYRS